MDEKATEREERRGKREGIVERRNVEKRVRK